MIKTIKIDDKSVKFSTNFAWMLAYKSQFDEDPAVLVMNLTNEDSKGLGFIDAAKLAWACAYAADNTIPPFEEWTESFDSFPVMTVTTDLLPEIIKSLATKKNQKTSA